MKKKPSSAKRSIQQQTFSPYVSSKRLRCVQSLLMNNDAGEDAILVILGIDSRYNEGCRELANYLLFGFFDLRLTQLEESGIPEEELDDVIILIRLNSVAVYCSSVLYSYLLPYIAHWRNLQIHCWPESDETKDNQEEREEYKIKSFISMLHGSSHVGIPYWATRGVGIAHHLQSPQTFDKFAIEKWPLVQSFALEGMGGGGFFTMVYDVSNVRNKLLPIYEECDPANLEQILVKSLPLFERHWEEAVSTISRSSEDEKLKIADLNVSEGTVAEPLKSYYSHGRLSEQTDLEKKALNNANCQVEPYVSFGTRSNGGGKNSPKWTLSNSGHNCNALHTVIYSSAPRKPISCIRTYFIQPPQENVSAMQDFELLVGLYSACVEACYSAIQKYCESFNIEDARSAVKLVISRACAHYPHSGSHEFLLEAFNNSTEVVPLTKKMSMHYVKHVTVSITSIKSKDGGVLGTVSYSDTFIDSTIYSSNADASGNEPKVKNLTNHIILTSGIPRYMEWKMKSEDTDDAANDRMIAQCDNVHMCSNSPLLSSKTECSVTFFADGSFSIFPSNAPRFKIKAALIENYSYYDSGLPNAVSLLQVVLKQTSALPKYLRPTEKTLLAFAFFPRSSAMRILVTKGIPHLQEICRSSNYPNYVSLGHIDDDIINPYKEIQSLYMWHAGISHRTENVRSTKLTKATFSMQPQLTDFMKHFGIGFVLGEQPIPDADCHLMLEKDTALNGSAPLDKEGKICISIVAGIPGSHGDHLCASLVSLHRERVRWVIVRAISTQGDATKLDEDHLQKQLTDFVSKRRTTRPGAAATKRLRIIIELTGFFDIADVVSCIVNHKNPTTREHTYIGAVTVCINPKACYMEFKLLLPKVLEQCTAGFVTCVAFTGEHVDLKDENLASMQSLIRLVNPNAAFLLAAGGQTSRSGDFDHVLSEESFQSDENLTTRHLSLPGWNGNFDSGRFPLKLQDILLEFSQPLLKGTLSARLRALKHSLTPHPYTGNIYMMKGVIAVTETPEQENDICFVAKTSTLELCPKAQPQVKAPAPPRSKNAITTRPYHLHCYGTGINEGMLRDWLRKCGRQKPSKKCHKTRATLSLAEKKSLQMKHHNDPLPEGFFYNGTQYCSLIDTSKSYEHPCLEEFIQEYLKAENKEIDAFNKKIDEQSIVDMFE